MRKYLLVILTGWTVFIGTVLPFSSAIHFDFANLDDYYYTQIDPVIGGVTWNNIKWAFTYVGDAIWMPLTWLSYQLDWDVSRLSWFVAKGISISTIMHSHSLVLHGVNAILLGVFLVILLKKVSLLTGKITPMPQIVGLAILGVLFWAVHPLRVESVVWVAARKDVLSMMFFLGALISWVQMRSVKNALMMGCWYGVCILCYVLGVFAKPSVMTFPLLAFLMDWLLLRQVSICDLNIHGEKFNVTKLLPLWPYILFIPLASITAYEAAWAQKMGGACEGLADVPLYGRLANASAAYGIYIWHTLWPSRLCLECLNRWPQWPRFMLPGLVITGCIIVYFWRMVLMRVICVNGDWMEKRSNVGDIILAALLWFSIAIFPMLGIANFGVHAFADRFTYIPSLAFSILVSVGGLVCFSSRYKEYLHCCVVGLMIAGLGATTVHQVSYWRDDQTNWSHTLAVDGNHNDMALNSLGTDAFEFRHDVSRALEYFRAAWQLKPSLRYLFPYILALADSGGDAVEEAGKLYNHFTTWVDSENAKEMMLDGKAKDSRMSYMTYRYVRIAYFIIDPIFRKAAHEELEGNLAIEPNDQHLLYLKALLACKHGDQETARICRNRIRAISKPTDPYFRYRWLGNEMEKVMRNNH